MCPLPSSAAPSFTYTPFFIPTSVPTLLTPTLFVAGDTDSKGRVNWTDTLYQGVPGGFTQKGLSMALCLPLSTSNL